MVSMERNGYYPLTHHCVARNVPGRSGIYTLAIHLPNGVYKTFFTSGSENIHRSLMNLARGSEKNLPVEVHKYLDSFRCYFTYFVILDPHQRESIAKMVSSTCDPIVQLHMISCN